MGPRKVRPSEARVCTVYSSSNSGGYEVPSLHGHGPRSRSRSKSRSKVSKEFDSDFKDELRSFHDAVTQFAWKKGAYDKKGHIKGQGQSKVYGHGHQRPQTRKEYRDPQELCVDSDDEDPERVSLTVASDEDASDFKRPRQN